MTYIIQGSFQLQNATKPDLNLFPIHFRKFGGLAKLKQKNFIRKNMLLLTLLLTLI